MKKIVVVLLIGVLMIGVLVVPALTKGGSAKGTDVHWDVVYKAIFKTTGSGIVHQWRYAPTDLHLIFKPITKFPNPPDGTGWFLWTAAAVSELGDDQGDVMDFLLPGTQWYVKITVQG